MGPWTGVLYSRFSHGVNENQNWKSFEKYLIFRNFGRKLS